MISMHFANTRGVVGTKVFYRGNVAYPNHSYGICGDLEDFHSTTVFMKCGVNASSGRQERYILKTGLQLFYPLQEISMSLCMVT